MTPLESEFETLLGKDLHSITQMTGGRNSSVYALIASSEQKYVGKRYFKGDGRAESRLDTEFKALTFLRRQGFQDVPKPVAMDLNCMCAVYEFMEGVSVNPSEATKSDIQSLIEFLDRLCRLNQTKESRAMPNASDACFSGEYPISLVDREDGDNVAQLSFLTQLA